MFGVPGAPLTKTYPPHSSCAAQKAWQSAMPAASLVFLGYFWLSCGTSAHARSEPLWSFHGTGDAASQEQGPFGLRGRRHEPRVSLSRGLAATLRGIDLPCSSNHGAGNRRYFPRRVLERAGRLLQERLHRAVLCCDHDRARLKGEA